MELVIVITLWSLGLAAAVGTPAFFLLRDRLRWTRLPHTRAFVQKKPGGSVPSPAVQDDALLSFVDEWRKASFDSNGAGKILTHLRDLHIEWRFGDFFTDPALGNGEIKARGWTPNSKHIIIAIWEGATLGETAFFHELMHVALDVTTGEPDPDHEGDKYPGWTSEHTAMIIELKRKYSQTFGKVTFAGPGGSTFHGLRVVGDNTKASVRVETMPEGVRYCASCVKDVEN